MSRMKDRSSWQVRWIAAIPLALLSLASSLEAQTTVAATLRFEEEGLDLDSGDVVATTVMDAIVREDTSAADIWFSYNADRAPHAVVVQDASRGLEIAFLDATPFAYVNDTDVPNLTLGIELKDFALEIDDTVVVRTDTGAVFKIGNAVEDEAGVSFEYERLDQTVAGLLPGAADRLPSRQGVGAGGELAAELPPGVSPEASSRVPERIDEGGYEVSQAGVSRAPGRAAEAARPSFRAQNREQELEIEFAPTGVTFTALGRAKTRWEWTMALEGWGYGASLRPTPEPVLVSSANRIEYRRGEVVEWYVNEGRGLEQGFTFASPPERQDEVAGPLNVTLALSGSLEPALTEDGSALLLTGALGDAVVRYAGLVAWDAEGRELPATMRLVEDRLTLAVQDTGAVYPVTIDPTVTQEFKLTANDAAERDNFGRSVSMTPDTVVVGAFLDDDACPGFVHCNSGSAYVFARDLASWHYEAKLTASDAAADDVLGFSVGIDDDTVVVGANNHGGAGAAYIFQRQGSVWSEEAKLTSPNAAPGDKFGSSVAISGGTVVLGADLDGHAGQYSGAAYVFSRSGSGWVEEAKLTASDAAAFDFFGSPVAIYGDIVVVGARGNDDAGSFSGSAYVFRRDGAGWSEHAKLTASDATAFDFFGRPVAIHGDRIVAGAFGDDDLGALSGSAYVFVEAGDGSWSQEAKLTASDGEAFDFFGFWAAIFGDTVVIGAQGDDDAAPAAGAAYVFSRSGTSWTEDVKLTAGDAATQDFFGTALATSGDAVVVGAAGNDDAGTNSGSAYVYELARDPASLILALVDKVESINLQRGIDNSLDAKLDAALQALDDVNENNDVAAANALDAFINAVSAQAGQHIAQGDADALIAAAQEIIDLLNGL